MKILVGLYFFLVFNLLSAQDTICYYKLNLDGCSKCYRNIENISKYKIVFVLESGYHEISKELINSIYPEYSLNYESIASDSLYENFSANKSDNLKILMCEKEIFVGKINDFALDKVKLSNKNQNDTIFIQYKIHPNCQLLNGGNNYIVFDKLLQQVVILDNLGRLKRKLKNDSNFQKKIYSYYYSDTVSYRKVIGLLKDNNIPSLQFKSVNYIDSIIYLVFNLYTLDFSGDSAKPQFVLGVLEINGSRMKHYFVRSDALKKEHAIIDISPVNVKDSLFYFDILNLNGIRDNIQIVFKKNDKSLNLYGYSYDSLPQYFIDQKLGFSLNNRCYSKKFIGYAVSGEIYYRNYKINNNELFRSFEYKGSFDNIPNAIIALNEINDTLIVLYLKDNYFRISKYVFKNGNMNQYEYFEYPLLIDKSFVNNTPTLTNDSVLFLSSRQNLIISINYR